MTISMSSNNQKKNIVLIASSVVLAAAFLLFVLLPTIYGDEQQSLMQDVLQNFAIGYGPAVAGILESCLSKASVASTVFSGIYTVFQGIAFGLIILYTLIEIINKAKTGEATLDMFLKVFIKAVLAALAVMFAQDIMNIIDTGLMRLVGTIKPMWERFIGDVMSPAFETTQDVGFWLRMIAIIIIRLLGWVFGWIILLVVKIMTYSIVLELMMRKIFVPIALVGVIEEGTRNPGLRYMKRLVAVYLKMIVVVSAFYLAGFVGMASIIGVPAATEGGTVEMTPTGDFFDYIFGVWAFDLAAVALTRRGTALAEDVMGV